MSSVFSGPFSFPAQPGRNPFGQNLCGELYGRRGIEMSLNEEAERLALSRRAKNLKRREAKCPDSPASQESAFRRSEVWLDIVLRGHEPRLERRDKRIVGEFHEY